MTGGGEVGRAEIAGGRHFGFEPEKARGRALEDQPLLARIDLGVVIEAVRHPAVVERRPARILSGALT